MVNFKKEFSITPKEDSGYSIKNHLGINQAKQPSVG
jgi:hypothetical protein